MITIYTRTTCAQCNTVKRYLNAKQVKFELINLDEPDNWDLAQELDNKGLRNVPITTNEKKERYVTGFNPAEIAKLL